ncbi:HupE/UreJ family protein [Leptolyngbya sp. GB1-A1]|uniref:HupE/UreJ family protein n=1 Tax=Leptolyngbya sp. GB1-A1 TaxID=2933908 RepID=UPI0032982365
MYAKFSTLLNRKLVICGLTGSSLLLSSSPALAHHPFWDKAPANVFEGFLSGLGHPVIGPDHLAFVIAVGFVAVVFQRGLLIPISFVVASLVGTIVHLLNVDLPAPEFFISASVLLFGLLLALKNSLPSGVVIALAAVAGLFHGYAYGEAVVGSEMFPLLAYLVGFTTIQMAIAIGVYLTVEGMGGSREQQTMNLRFAGFTLAGIGVAFLSGVVLN